MSSLLQFAFVDEHCNACGERYRVTLYDLLQEYRVQREWRPGRPLCSACSVSPSRLLHAIPEAAIEALAAAWEDVVEAARHAGLDLRTGV